MKREDLQKEIAKLDKEINSLLGAVELPRVHYRPFPFGAWLFAGACYAWALFGGMIPGAYLYHLETAIWAYRVAIVIAIIAFLSTIAWLFSGRDSQQKSDAYMANSRKARDLQEKRRELQQELRSLTKE